RPQRETPDGDAPKNGGNRELYLRRTPLLPPVTNGFAGRGMRAGPRLALPFRAIAKARARSQRCVHPSFPNRKCARLHLHRAPAAPLSVRARAGTIVETIPG